ncbi:hypothetical protein [Natranaerobius trueperi]|uniref:Uncharacterized protein n=1 Tax=Natranaerobius trueperi TaxID=759412 RepID=A0A226C014_9FIRM|nr:hypothetical protein [Natranaerobius trueperi]OWZ83710.1 hypothetical protein CDO51_07085 [Natranaerobius trueperi]
MSIYPLLSARGVNLIIPVGREKLIPSVKEASKTLGINNIDKRIGMSCGMMPITNGKVITEIEAFEILFEVSATHVASDGVGGSEGSCTFVLEGDEDKIENAFQLVKDIKKEPALTGNKKTCTDCHDFCEK